MTNLQQFFIRQKSIDNAVIPGKIDYLQERKIHYQPTSVLVKELCQGLHAQNINYCHWKSNNALDRSASGENDLDLLVSRADAERFNEILFKLGFKQAEAPGLNWMPGVLDYYGFDYEADKLIHVHAHYQLVIGHDMTKNYRLPLESQYLESANQEELFRVPEIEFEFVVFVIRMILKHSTWDTMLIKHEKLTPSERQELAYLEIRVDHKAVNDILIQHLPFISEDLFRSCVRALENDSTLWTRIVAGEKLRNSLKPFARYGKYRDVVLKIWRRISTGIKRKVLKRKPRRRLMNGGSIIALVGGDGAGKSSAITALLDWLSNDLDVYYVHLGRPKWSFTTKAVRGVLRLGRLLGLIPYIKSSFQYVDDIDALPKIERYALFLREYCKARDRYLTFMRIQRIAMNGGLVISDRYPISQIKLMDGPYIEHSLKSDQLDWFSKCLSRAEKKYYESIVCPDLLFVLKLDPEIAVHRKEEDGVIYVRARSQEIWSIDWDLTSACVVDANLSRQEVWGILKSKIWSYI